MDNATATDIRKKADVWELAGISFMTDDGKFARDKGECTVIELTFIDGTIYKTTPGEMVKLDDYNFKLVPKNLDS